MQRTLSHSALLLHVARTVYAVQQPGMSFQGNIHLDPDVREGYAMSAKGDEPEVSLCLDAPDEVD